MKFFKEHYFGAQMEYMTKNLNKYIKLYDKYHKSDDSDIQDEVQEQIEEMWFDLNDDEIAHIETKNLII